LDRLALRQQIPLGVCLAAGTREDLPAAWFSRDASGVFLDLHQAMQNAVVAADDGSALASLISAVGGWDKARVACLQSYSERIKEVESDLLALMDERKERHNQGQPTGESERAIQSILRADLIGILAKRGFLPRYAFPLDVVELVTKTDRYSDSEVELSRDRGQAIAEYAPGAQVVARKQLYSSGGLFFTTRKEMPPRKYFWRCSKCQLVRTELTKDKLKAVLGDTCPACKEQKVREPTFRHFVEPVAFMHDEKAKASFGRSKPIRQRQGLTHFIDTLLEGVTFSSHPGFMVGIKKDGKLFRYNCGPGNKGFHLCGRCGRSESVAQTGATQPQHRWLRFRPDFRGKERCTATGGSAPVAYGHVFESFCLIAQPLQSAPSRESLGYALHRGLCQVLELDLNEVGVSFRRSTNGGDEIILFDKAPGGAGLVTEAAERWDEVVTSAKTLMQSCTCERACYNCLKDFSNQTHHEKLDRTSTGIPMS
jgi:hypothetical protein